MRGNILYCIRIDTRMAYDCSSIKVKVGNDQETVQSEIPTQKQTRREKLARISTQFHSNKDNDSMCFFKQK